MKDFWRDHLEFFRNGKVDWESSIPKIQKEIELDLRQERQLDQDLMQSVRDLMIEENRSGGILLSEIARAIWSSPNHNCKDIVLLYKKLDDLIQDSGDFHISLDGYIFYLPTLS